MGNTGGRGGHGGLESRLATWPRAQWKSLLAALLASLFAHVVLLALVRVPREGDGRAPAFVVSLTGTMPARRSETPAAPAASVTRTVPQPQRRREPQEQPTPRPRPAAVSSSVERSVRPSPAPPPARPQSTPAPEVQAPVLRDAPVQPASPVSMPEFGEVARKVTGRRLQATVWVDAEGRVTEAFVKRNEISEEVAVLLQQALAAVRFAPATQGGRPVADVLEKRLCFDSAGVLVALDADCLQPGSAEPPESAPLR